MVGHRVHEQLVNRGRYPAVARGERDHRREIAARAVATDRDPRGIAFPPSEETAPPAPPVAEPTAARPLPTAPVARPAATKPSLTPKTEPSKPKKPKEVYYNIVGEPMPSDDD